MDESVLTKESSKSGWLTWVYRLIAVTLVVPVALFLTALTSFLVVVLSYSPVKAQESMWFCIHRWARWILPLFQMKVKVFGLANLPPPGAIYLFNHTSHLDIPVLFASLPRRLLFGAKSELFRIPIFGRSMRVVGALPIHRGDRKKVLSLYSQSVEKVKQGKDYVLAPEGTRQWGDRLGSFKTGPFLFALQGGLTLVPVVLVNVSRVIPKHALIPHWSLFRKTPIEVHILDAISTEGLGLSDLENLQGQVKEKMAKVYEERMAQINQ